MGKKNKDNEEVKPNVYTIEKVDDNSYRVVGLKSPYLKSRDHYVVVQNDHDIKDVIQEIAETNKLVKDGDIFDTKDGKFVLAGVLALPYEQPEEKPEEHPEDCKCESSPSDKEVVLPVLAEDSNGKMYAGNIGPIPWPSSTNSKVLEEFDKVFGSIKQGNLVSSITVRHSNRRLLEIHYGDIQVVASVG